jgi:hypothetical protein
MKIAQHSVTLTTPARVPAQTHSAQTGSTTSGQTSKAVNPFAALVTSRLPAASSGEGVAVKAPAAPVTAKTTTVTVNPLASWVTCGPPPANPASATATAAAATEVAPVNPLAGLVTATPAVTAASTGSSTPVTVPAQPGIGALISAIMNGSFQPTYMNPSQLVENTPAGTIFNSPAYYASDQTAQQLATLLGGTVVQKVPFASSDATTTEIKANFIQLPSGQTVNAADLAYYAKFGGYGVQQLAADLTQEINQGGAITSYNDQMVAFLSGTGDFPGETPTFQPNVIGPAIAGMTYPPGTLAADGSVINPMAPNRIGS